MGGLQDIEFFDLDDHLNPSAAAIVTLPLQKGEEKLGQNWCCNYTLRANLL